ncbi:hypothetical protein, partial [Herbaspirillum sp.]|uniref:hypothetical protein n=1 Tax=Herbaspirillum sp. TaxID=1890675 RepID=UPI0031DF4A49
APTLLLLTFLGETRKVSGCRAAPGAPLRPKKEKTKASTSARSKTRLPKTTKQLSKCKNILSHKKPTAL